MTINSIQKCSQKIFGFCLIDKRQTNTFFLLTCLKHYTSVSYVLTKCSILNAICKKALKLKNLKHIERLTLLYTIGHIGDEGKTHLHKIISACENYNSRVTQKWIERVKNNLNPLSCKKIKEWLKDYLPGVNCACGQVQRIITPIDLIKQKPELKLKMNNSSDRINDDWSVLKKDLFDC